MIGALLKYDHLDLPTYRMIDYWARNGALGDELMDVGSGVAREFSGHTVFKLAALKCVSDDLRSLGLRGITLDLVRRLWLLLDDSPVATLTIGSVSIVARLPE